MGPYKKLWFTLIGVMIVTFSLLGYYGVEVYRQAPPIPAQVTNADGKVLFDREGILDGQTAWQSVGGMQLGSIWGHGAYQAPDWTADWLHRELTAWLDLAARDTHGKAYATLDGPAQAALREQLRAEYRGNRVDAAAGAQAVRTPGSGHRADGQLLRPAVLGRALAAKEPRAFRDEGKHPAQRRAAPADDAVLLLDRMGRSHRASGPEGHLHQQLAA
jgi:hypothetical protein